MGLSSPIPGLAFSCGIGGGEIWMGLVFIRRQSSQDVPLGMQDKWGKEKMEDTCWVLTWAATAHPAAEHWSHVTLRLSQAPFKSPHCTINLSPWHYVSKPHDLAQPTSPTLPPTAILHIPDFPIKAVFQFASSCSHTQNAFPSVPGILHRPWKMPHVPQRLLWLSQQEQTTCPYISIYLLTWPLSVL